MTRRLLLIALAVTSLGIAACGDTDKTITNGESEASYVTLGQMQYQVQVSRQLNAANPGDAALLIGIPPADRGLTADQIWFAVWVRVFNRSDQPDLSADEFKIVDTRGRVFEPIPFAHTNAFAYRPGTVPAGDEYPVPGSVAQSMPQTGALLVFKLPVEALDFRPLELAFTRANLAGQESTVRLDV